MNVSFRAYASVSLLSLILVLLIAGISHDSLFDALCYLSTTKISLLVIFNCAAVTLLFFVKLLLGFFVGQLRDLEIEQIFEAGRGFLMDTVVFLVLSSPTLAGREAPTGVLFQFVGLAIVLKVFHMLVQIRVAYVFESGFPRPETLRKLLGLICVLGILDIIAVKSFYSRADQKSSLYLWLLFEALGMLTLITANLIKFILHFIDFTLEGGWAPKSSYIFFLDVISDIVSLGIFLVFMMLFVAYYPNRLPFHMASDIFLVARALFIKVRSFQRYRLLVQSMTQKFPEATFEELEEADTCIVCRELLQEGARKLPCGHVFHVPCLKAWFVQQQACPTCRLNVFPANGAGAASGTDTQAASAGQVDQSSLPSATPTDNPEREVVPAVDASSFSLTNSRVLTDLSNEKNATSEDENNPLQEGSNGSRKEKNHLAAISPQRSLKTCVGQVFNDMVGWITLPDSVSDDCRWSVNRWTESRRAKLVKKAIYIDNYNQRKPLFAVDEATATHERDTWNEFKKLDTSSHSSSSTVTKKRALHNNAATIQNGLKANIDEAKQMAENFRRLSVYWYNVATDKNHEDVLNNEKNNVSSSSSILFPESYPDISMQVIDGVPHIRYEMSLNATKVLHPTLKWGQDVRCVYVTATFSGACVNQEDVKCSFSQNLAEESSLGAIDRLKIESPTHKVDLVLFEPCLNATSNFKPDGSLFISFQKKRVYNWPRLTQSKDKHPYIYTDWLLWPDSDDEVDEKRTKNHEVNDTLPNVSSLADDVATFSMLGPIEVHPNDCKDIENSPNLLNIEEVDTQNYWVNELTQAQRLHTLARMWNCLLPEHRSDVLKELVKLMNHVDAHMSANIKGGAEILQELNAEEYSKRGITYCGTWVDQLASVALPDQQLSILVQLFSLTTDFEKKVVCSTFI